MDSSELIQIEPLVHKATATVCLSVPLCTSCRRSSSQTALSEAQQQFAFSGYLFPPKLVLDVLNGL